ncbi:MAG: hypothetical protein A2600_03185 [Candidatus Lambdaproteobacteria bacterium RIFOXYD1_FULL_56_27]|uniref:Lipid A biosynthesis acyltransferase n=1 Tax=Candidatus Lambdaproteobacteria bacterium RIFOXYD2_FULL_56_26 TaxID=1817773 RepID=A0A1F6H334_9PROT|nr:MAG: hypothetical protein A2557_07250 [Candidatus Lambdaproteobacteria bacterium RIFOXYD2_FULL_56_26]OGH05396.1 MAG: hypothetical protein A2426_05575 [Candidatus Lambdaproteobacteria bacterium RIFOXYC1_FULL_56_13]OGH09240.1 MAG: hypothetical protein A2600_03185 [Candidatus Lambdaproteobacteria bacterium RIFOXYD1_FULL_56_27]
MTEEIQPLPLWVQLRHQLERLLFLFLLELVRALSPQEAAAVGRWIGRQLFRFGVRRKVVDRNLEIAFPQLSKPELEALSLRCYQNMGSHLLEFLKLDSVPPQDLDRLVSLEGAEELKAAIAQGKGVVIAGSHFGHWELLSAAISRFVYPVAAYAGKQTNEWIDGRINLLRNRFGLQTITKSPRSNREMLQCLKDQGILGILGDLNVPHKHLFVDFFGVKAAAGPGLGRFVAKGKCPLFFIWITREGAARHKGHIIKLDYHLSGDLEADIAQIAQSYFSALEAKIKEYPDHYFWFNRRFKTRPVEEDQAGVKLYEKTD